MPLFTQFDAESYSIMPAAVAQTEPAPAPVVSPVKKTDEVAVNCEVVAFVNCCRAVHQFVLPRFKSAVIVPLVVTGVEPIVRVEFVEESPTDVTVPVPPTQVPFIA